MSRQKKCLGRPGQTWRDCVLGKTSATLGELGRSEGPIHRRSPKKHICTDRDRIPIASAVLVRCRNTGSCVCRSGYASACTLSPDGRCTTDWSTERLAGRRGPQEWLAGCRPLVCAGAKGRLISVFNRPAPGLFPLYICQPSSPGLLPTYYDNGDRTLAARGQRLWQLGNFQ